MKSDRPSWFSRAIYGVERMRTPFRSGLNGISWSENSSRSSLISMSSVSTAATSLADEDEYDSMEDILVAKTNANVQHVFTNAQSTFRDDLHNHLNEALGSHEYLSRLRLVGRDSASFRPAVLITTKSRRTKMAFAYYLRKGPSILRRLPYIELDIHIVLHNFGLAADHDSSSLSPSLSSMETSFRFDSDVNSNVAYLTTKDYKSGKETTFVSTMKLQVGEDLVMLSVYHPLATFDKRQVYWQEAARRYADASDPESNSGAVSIYYDEDLPEDLSPLGNSTEANFPLASDMYCFKRYNTMDRSYTIREIDTLYTVSNTSAVALPINPSVGDHDGRSLSTLPAFGHDRVLTTQLLSSGEDADWSLWRLPSQRTKHQSILMQSDQVDGQKIIEFCPEGCADQKDVLVSLPEGTVRGKMQSETVLYQIGLKQLRLQVMSLAEPLERGTSGALVTFGNQACGMVVAVDDQVAEAYVLSFSPIVKDIQRVTKKTVSLPSIASVGDKTLPTGLESNIVIAEGRNNVPEVCPTRPEGAESIKVFILLINILLGTVAEVSHEKFVPICSFECSNAISLRRGIDWLQYLMTIDVAVLMVLMSPDFNRKNNVITRLLRQVVTDQRFMDVSKLLPLNEILSSPLVYHHTDLSLLQFVAIEIYAKLLYLLPKNSTNVQPWTTVQSGMEGLLAHYVERILKHLIEGCPYRRQELIMQRPQGPWLAKAEDFGNYPSGTQQQILRIHCIWEDYVKEIWRFRTMFGPRLLQAVPYIDDTLVSDKLRNLNFQLCDRTNLAQADLVLDAWEVYKKQDRPQLCFGSASQLDDNLVSYIKPKYKSQPSSQLSTKITTPVSLLPNFFWAHVRQPHHYDACNGSFGRRPQLKRPGYEAILQRKFGYDPLYRHMTFSTRSEMQKHKNRCEVRFFFISTEFDTALSSRLVLMTTARLVWQTNEMIHFYQKCIDQFESMLGFAPFRCDLLKILEKLVKTTMDRPTEKFGRATKVGKHYWKIRHNPKVRCRQRSKTRRFVTIHDPDWQEENSFDASSFSKAGQILEVSWHEPPGDHRSGHWNNRRTTTSFEQPSESEELAEMSYQCTFNDTNEDEREDITTNNNRLSGSAASTTEKRSKRHRLREYLRRIGGKALMFHRRKQHTRGILKYENALQTASDDGRENVV